MLPAAGGASRGSLTFLFFIIHRMILWKEGEAAICVLVMYFREEGGISLQRSW